MMLCEAQQMNSHIVVENESTIPDDDEYQTANENYYITDTDTESESEHEENLPPDELTQMVHHKLLLNQWNQIKLLRTITIEVSALNPKLIKIVTRF